MNDYGNDPNWFIDANGNRYQRKATASVFPRQQTFDDRHPLLGPGIGHRRTDKIFDGIAAALILAVGITMTVGFLKYTDQSQPVNRPAVTVTDTGSCGK